MLNKDYKEMLQSLLKNEVKFLVIGAYALGVYGYPRATGDFDIWVENSLINSKKIYQALLDLKAPVSQISQNTFAKKNIVYQLGVNPRRIDILTSIDGVDFKQVYKDREIIELENLKVPFISKNNLIKNKKATARPQDLIDIKKLKEKK